MFLKLRLEKIDLAGRIALDKVLHDKPFEMANTKKRGRYQCGPASIV